MRGKGERKVDCLRLIPSAQMGLPNDSAVSALEEQAQGFHEIVSRFLNGGTLAGGVLLGAERLVAALFALDILASLSRVAVSAVAEGRATEETMRYRKLHRKVRFDRPVSDNATYHSRARDGRWPGHPL